MATTLPVHLQAKVRRDKNIIKTGTSPLFYSDLIYLYKSLKIVSNSLSLLVAADGCLRTMFYFPYDPIEEENESKLSSEGEIRTDVSNTDESFELNLQQYMEICDEPNENMIGTKLDIDCVMREEEEDKKDSD